MINLKLWYKIPPLLKGKISFWLQLIMFIISVGTLGAVIVDYGFLLDEHETLVVYKIYHYAWWTYFISFILRVTIEWQNITRKTVFMTVLLGSLLLLSGVPKIVIHSETHHWYSDFYLFISSKLFLTAVLSLYAVFEVSKGVVNFINKKTNPALLMAACFAVIILLGALILLLPRSTHAGVRLSLIDALFVSTSAVCVTGLSPVDIAATFSHEGQIVIAMLIQIGGLGVMTITSFFAMFFMGGTGLYNQFALREMVGSETFTSLISTLLYILGFTFVIEAFGALGLWFSIHSTLNMNLHDEIFFSIFHSVSAFCNAGFSTLPGNLGNNAVIRGHNEFFLIISLLVVLGSIGFPLLMNLKQVIFYHAKKLYAKLSFAQVKPSRYIHLTNINTKIVLVMTFLLVVCGTIVIAYIEWNRAFAGLPVYDKIVQSIFNAVTPRTAGFNSIDLADFSLLTIVVFIILMWIGGASQSTAGGIKVNTFAVAMANLLSVIRGRKCVILFHREIADESVRRASAVIFGSLLTIVCSFMFLVEMEPNISPLGLLFETVSAYCTVGLSLNVTPHLSEESKLLLSLLMFMGRVGLITVLMSFIQHAGTLKYKFPKDSIIIN